MTGGVQDIDLLRRRVLNVVGHELRTPVTTLSGLAAELEHCDDDDRRQELASAVARNARRLDRLVDDLLLAAGITTVAPVDDRQPVDLIGMAKSLWTGSTATFTGTATAVARPQAVQRALAEVLRNARLHGAPPFAITAFDEADCAVIEVSSGGEEQTEEALTMAIELFFRGEKAVTTAAGLGVGLPLARTLVRADGGDLVLRPRPGGGVVARIELPAP